MKTIRKVLLINALIVAFIMNAGAQTNLQFTSANVTAEGAIQLHWASQSNEVYEIDYADQLAGNPDGSTAWNKLYEDYPSHGTNSFITDAGNYDITPEILHPKSLPMRFYRVTLVQTNDSASNPVVSITFPTNDASLSGEIIVSVSASAEDILSEVKLYIDGEEQWYSGDGTNFVINTCEWPNGPHTIFATAKSQSGFEGVANGGVITYGRSVSSYVNVSFDNLIERFDFSEPFFEPDLGQTQHVSAVFAANCNWILDIQDASSNTVRTETGSGSSMQFDWDGTGTGGTNLPNGIYSYLLTVETNGQQMMMLNEITGNSSSSSLPSSEIPELWALPKNSDRPVPLALYPPGFDTNDFTIFEASPLELSALNTSLSVRSVTVSGGTSVAMESMTYSSPSQSTRGPKRKPKVGIKGQVGSFGICYKTYGTGGFSSPHPLTGWPAPLQTRVAIDGQTPTALTVDYRIKSFTKMADDFREVMTKAAWKKAFVKKDDQWGAIDIKKASLGGNSIFNTCNFGILMTHGSYANNNNQGNSSDAVKYTYNWLGGNNYVKLSDMDFGSGGTNGLRWMTIFACNILKPENYASMYFAGKIPVNENLHLLLGFSTTGYAIENLGKYYANYLAFTNSSIINSLADACTDAYSESKAGSITNTVRIGITGYQSCWNDSLQLYNDPDLNDLDYQERTVYIPQ